MIKIDKKVRIPTGVASGGNKGKYPWRSMEIGDSFFVPGKTPTGMSAPAFAKADGWQFTFRSVQESGVDGLRIWRIQ